MSFTADHAPLGLLLADDDREGGAARVGRLHLALERPARSPARSTQPASRSSCSTTSAADDPSRMPSTTNTSARALGGGHHALGVGRDQQALDADAEPDARRRRSAHLLGQPVVASAAADGVLGGVEGVGRELERGARVVVEPAHEAGVRRRSRLPSASRPWRTRSKCSRRRVGQVVDHHRRAGRDLDVAVALGIQHPQGVQLEALLGVGRQLAVPLAQPVAQRRRCRPGGSRRRPAS